MKHICITLALLLAGCTATKPRPAPHDPHWDEWPRKQQAQVQREYKRTGELYRYDPNHE
jgi:outer membrane biogenesis lipoprotein LolB